MFTLGIKLLFAVDVSIQLETHPLIQSTGSIIHILPFSVPLNHGVFELVNSSGFIPRFVTTNWTMNKDNTRIGWHHKRYPSNATPQRILYDCSIVKFSIELIY